MKIAVVSSQANVLEDIGKILGAISNADKPILLERRPELPRALSDLGGCDLLIVDCMRQGKLEMEMIETLTRNNPKLAVLLLSPEKTPEILIEAMRSGVREVLSSPVIREELVAAVGRVKGRMPKVEPVNRHGKVVAFLPCKGGSGATFISTNLGYALATECHKEVLLIDLDFQFSDASYFISDTQAVASVADLATHPERLDANVLASSVIQVAPGYSLLPAPTNPEAAIGLRPEHIENLLKVASENYDFVILDIDRAVDILSIRALDRADVILVVTQMTVPHVRDSQHMLKLFEGLGYDDRKVQLLANRHDTTTDLTQKMVEKTLGKKFYWLLSNDFTHANASVNLGIPVSKHAPASVMARELSELAHDMAGVTKVRESWLSRFFHGAGNTGLLLNSKE